MWETNGAIMSGKVRSISHATRKEKGSWRRSEGEKNTSSNTYKKDVLKSGKGIYRSPRRNEMQPATEVTRPVFQTKDYSRRGESYCRIEMTCVQGSKRDLADEVSEGNDSTFFVCPWGSE